MDSCPLGLPTALLLVDHTHTEHFCTGSRARSALLCGCHLLLNFSGQLPPPRAQRDKPGSISFLKTFFFYVDHFFKFYSICYNTASVIGFGFLARRHL